MSEFFLKLLHGFPPALAAFIFSALPLTELRAALPIALTVFHLSPFAAYTLCVLGSLLPMPFIFLLLPPVLAWLERYIPALHRLFEHHLRSLELKHRKAYETYGPIFLVLWIALPIPGTGVWSASILAVIFRMKPRSSIPAICAGAALAGLMILLLTTGAVGVVHLFS